MDGDFVIDLKSNCYFFKERNFFINEIFLKWNVFINKINFLIDLIFWYIENVFLNFIYWCKILKLVCGLKVYNLIIVRIVKGVMYVYNDMWKMYVLYYIEIKCNCNKY